MTLQPSLQLSFILQNSPTASPWPGLWTIPSRNPAPAASLEDRYVRRGLRLIRPRWRPQPA